MSNNNLLAALKQKVTLELAQDSITNKGGNSFKDPIDELVYMPEKDKAGNAQAIIRFLPPSQDEDSAFIRLFKHSIWKKQGDKMRGFTHNCPTSIGESCCVCTSATDLWKSGLESNKELAKQQFKSTNFYANIIVLSDPKNPENEYKNSGKVWLFRYTKQIQDMISLAIQPEFEDEVGFNPFNPWEGANFKLKITKKDAFPSYLSSKFDPPTPLFGGDDDAILEVYLKQHKLSKLLLDPERFLSNAELEKKFLEFTSSSKPSAKTEKTKVREELEDDAFNVDMTSKSNNSSHLVAEDDDDDDLYSSLLDD